MKLYLIIGIPGSGKTTKAKEIIKEYEKSNIPIKHYEADMYFERDGKYMFDRDKLGMAHGWCKKKAEMAMNNNIDVIVSNTSLTPRERITYLKMAKDHNYEVEVITCTGEYQNIHGVPIETLESMKKRYVPFNKKELW